MDRLDTDTERNGNTVRGFIDAICTYILYMRFLQMEGRIIKSENARTTRTKSRKV